MNFAEQVALKLKQEYKIKAKPVEGFEHKDNLLLEINSDEIIQMMTYKKGLTGKKYYLSWAMEFNKASPYIPLVRKIEFDKEDFKNNPLEYSLFTDGHVAITTKKNMLWHLVIRETGKLEFITIGWVVKAVGDFLIKKQKVDSKLKRRK